MEVACEVVIFDSNVSYHDADDPKHRLRPWPLLAESADWLSAAEIAHHRVTYVVVAGLSMERAIHMHRPGMFTYDMPRQTLWAEAMRWLETARDGREPALDKRRVDDPHDAFHRRERAAAPASACARASCEEHADLF